MVGGMGYKEACHRQSLSQKGKRDLASAGRRPVIIRPFHKNVKGRRDLAYVGARPVVIRPFHTNVKGRRDLP
jgi:hypothetical protein